MEESARILAGALRASVKPGLNRLEVQRLQTVANISNAYKEHLIDFVHYRDVEKKLEKVEEQNAQLQKTLEEILARSPNSTPQPVSG